MKTLLLLLVLCIIESLALDEKENEPLHMGVLVRSYPKKYNSVFHRHLNILNRKYSKTIPPPVTKKVNLDAIYTVFPPLPGQHKKIPESPYFSMGSYSEHKPRVKKVLPDYGWKHSLRRKRSAPPPPPQKPEIKVPKYKLSAGSVAAVPVNRKSGSAVLHKYRRSGDSAKKAKEENENTKKAATKHLAKKGFEKKISANSTDKPAIQRRLRKDESRRLIAAEDATIEMYPYMVSIQKNGEHWCSGALVNQRMVITTANCVWKSTQTSFLKVRACSRYTDHGGQVARIQELMKHPDWSIRKQPDNDVALLVLDRYLSASHSCHHLDLPNRVMSPNFDDVWVASYGSERRDGIMDRSEMTLQVIHAPLINRDACNNVTQRYGVSVSRNFICVSQAGRRSPCTRDTGAPAVSDGVVWGLASWGIRKLCGTERFPAMFSFLASNSNMDFIAKAQKRLMGEERQYPFPDRYHYMPRQAEATVTQHNPFAAP